MKIYVSSVAEARDYVKRNYNPSFTIIFVNYNGTVIAQWLPDGFSSGIILTARNYKKLNKLVYHKKNDIHQKFLGG